MWLLVFCRLSLLSCPFLLHPTRKSILSQNTLIATPDILGINSGTSKMQRNLLKTKISCFRRTKKKHGCVLCGANLLLAKSSKAAALSLFLLGILWHYALKVVGNVFTGRRPICVQFIQCFLTSLIEQFVTCEKM